MPVNDPVGDMLTRIRNAVRARHDKVVVPHSKMKVEIARVLKDEGFVGDFLVRELAPQSEIVITLKYGPDRQAAVQNLTRISKPGLRKYIAVRDIRPVLGGLGIAILSTSRGIMSDVEARKQGVGGELIATIY